MLPSAQYMSTRILARQRVVVSLVDILAYSILRTFDAKQLSPHAFAIMSVSVDLVTGARESSVLFHRTVALLHHYI